MVKTSRATRDAGSTLTRSVALPHPNPRHRERMVLHVLPHPGGGGERYIDVMSAMPGFRFSRIYLASSPRPTVSVGRRLLDVARLARRHDLLHAHGEVVAALCLPLLASRPSVVTLHGLHLVRRLTGMVRAAAVLNLRCTLRATSQVICVSKAEYEELLRVAGDNAPPDRVVVIPNGVHLPPPSTAASRATVREELGIASDTIVAIWLGSLDEHKRPLIAVYAAERSGVTLLVVGDGPLRRHVEREANTHIHVLGHRADVHELLAASDFFVLTSIREGLSMALLEAMAHGLPAIVTDVPENVEALGRAGVIVAPDDVEKLADTMRHLAANADTRKAMGEQARERARTSFSAKAMIDRTRAVYEDVLGRSCTLELASE